MARLIDADKLKEVLDGYYYPEYGKPCFDLDFINDVIDKTPTVEERTKGEWKSDHEDEVCSVCGFRCDDMFYLGKANFCPECGSNMRKKVE